MFAVMDTKADAFLQPFFMPNKGMAQRLFVDSANDANHMFCKHSEDYILYQIGEFDQRTGEIFTAERPERLESAASVKNPNVYRNDITNDHVAIIKEVTAAVIKEKFESQMQFEDLSTADPEQVIGEIRESK